jgi:hypothetical protein
LKIILLTEYAVTRLKRGRGQETGRSAGAFWLLLSGGPQQYFVDNQPPWPGEDEGDDLGDFVGGVLTESGLINSC